MHFKIDEDLPPAVAQKLRHLGYACSTVWEQGLSGFKDPELWRTVQDHQQFLISADLGFSDIRRYPPGTHGGILLLRPNEHGIQPLLELIDLVLANIPDLRVLEGTLAVASRQGLRIRRPEA